MTRLIVTDDPSAAGGLVEAGRADIAIPFERRLVWGPLPSDVDAAESFAARRSQKQGDHWLDFVPATRLKRFGFTDMGLVDVCSRCESVELWFDPKPNAQLMLLWLLTQLRIHGKAAANVVLRHADLYIGDMDKNAIAKWDVPAVPITENHLEVAGLAWRAYRASTPQAWFNLLKEDLSLLPQLGPCAIELLEELPSAVTGLGATEMRILELISAGYVHPFTIFPHGESRLQRRVYGYWEIGCLLDGLALAGVPAVQGLAEWPFTLELHDLRERHERYSKSRLSLTSLGKALLEREDDFSRHNPIDRWWGGTHLTNDNLWRWNPALMKP
jgi:hypothetical protein